MKVLLINNCHYLRGGSETVYFNTGKLLMELGHEVLYFSFADVRNVPCNEEKYFPAFNNAAPQYIWEYFYNIRAAHALERLILEKGVPDIANINLIWGGLTSSICYVLKKYKIPIVHTVHDYRMICPAYTFKRIDGRVCESCKDGKYYHCIKHKCCKGSALKSVMMTMEMYFRNIVSNPSKLFDGLIYVSDFCKKKHLEFFPQLEQIHSTIIYNVSDLEKVRETPVSNYLLYYGRLSYEKGIMTLINAIKKHKDVYLKIVGTGPLEFEIKDYLSANNITNVDCLGFKTGYELQELIENCSFVIVPSEWYENNPLTIVEPYTLGKPVVGADIGGITEIINHGKTGFLFEPSNTEELSNIIDKIKTLKAFEYENMCSNAEAFAKENFNKSVNISRLLKFYQDVIDLHRIKK